MTGHDSLDALIVVLALMALAFVIPPKYDPAIRIKEWLERRR